MRWFRGRLPALLAAWLLFQLAGAAMPVVLMAAGAPVEQECTCPLGDHATCPMHHPASSTAGTTSAPGNDNGQCTMKNTCTTTDAALLGMAGGVGVLAPQAPFGVALLQTATLDDLAATAVSRVEFPDAPPPRF